MNPEYSHYDGTPNPVNGHGDFYSDAYRTAAETWDWQLRVVRQAGGLQSLCD
ncbi:MAG: hypothetical protein U5K84_12320 [Alkalibacterium sp.]|nr:hypothetical protein [Alkalibacterium sp.]